MRRLGRSPPTVPALIQLPDGTYTSSLRETAETLLTHHIRTDDPSTDTPWHLNLRAAISDFTTLGENSTPPDDEELVAHLRRCKFKKAPGPDGITAEILLPGKPRLLPHLLSLFRECLSQGVFPRCWKRGTLRLIPKSTLLDPSLAASYRPLTLLSLLGKTLERVMAERLNAHVDTVGLISVRQFGFRPGRGAADALATLRSRFEASTAPYVTAVFLDVRSAFDTAWWPLILERFRTTGLARDVYRLLCSYLEDRLIQFTFHGVTLERLLTLGCPQGSILGPLLWNVLINPLLDLPLPPNVYVQAYCDDIVLLVEARTRDDLQLAVNASLDLVSTFCASSRLQLSPIKTKALHFRSRSIRNPAIRLS